MTHARCSRLTKNSPFHDPYHGDPDWNLLHEYNIFDEGLCFLFLIPLVSS